MDELIKEFSFDKVHKAGAVFDRKKLDWMNGEYIKKLSNTKFVQLAMPYLQANIGEINSDLDTEKILAIEQQRVSKLSEVGEGVKFLFSDELDYDGKILIWKKSDADRARQALMMVKEKLEGVTDWSKGNLEKDIIDFITEKGMTNGEVLWPLRVALTGQEKSPTPFEVAEILGKENSLKRIQQAIEKI